MSKWAARVKRLRWRADPPTAAELLAMARRATRKSPHSLPPWSSLAIMVPFYEEARRRTIETGIAHEVDHYFPLLNGVVCGLHVPANVRVVTAAENALKGNRMPSGDPETWLAAGELGARSTGRATRRPTNPPYHVMFPNGLFHGRRTRC